MRLKRYLDESKLITYPEAKKLGIENAVEKSYMDKVPLPRAEKIANVKHWKKKHKIMLVLTVDIKDLTEKITLDISVGDVILGGKFKNKKVIVKKINKTDKGDIAINGRPLLKYRILDKQPEDM